METESIIDKVALQAKEYKTQGNGCSVSVALALRDIFGGEVPQETLYSMVLGLGGGMGFTQEGVCGALSGASVAMGMYFQNDHKTARKLSKELTKDFQNAMGNIICKHILTGNGEKRCMECVETAARRATELLLQAGTVPANQK